MEKKIVHYSFFDLFYHFCHGFTIKNQIDLVYQFNLI